MANLNDAVLQFVTLDTRKQDEVLRRVGLDTEVGDRLLGALRGNAPERFDALVAFGGVLDADDSTLRYSHSTGEGPVLVGVA